MNKQKLFWKIPSALILFLIIIIAGCGQRKTDGNIKWISKYNFFDLYKTNLNGFNPGTGLKFSVFKISNEKTIFLGGSKDLYEFYKKPGDSAVLFISKDLGKSYEEIIFPEENLISIINSTNYSIIVTNTGGNGVNSKNLIYVFDNNNYKFKKIDEFASDENISNLQFNGKYLIYPKYNKTHLVDIFNQESFILPNNVVKSGFILDENKPFIIYLENQNIKSYNFLDTSIQIVKQLKSSYSTISNKYGEILLGKANILKNGGSMFDLNEKELFEVSPTTSSYYRYKNFACEVTQTMPKFSIKYSYDYGRTWKEYSNKDFITAINPIGFYKDQYIILDAGLYKKKTSQGAGKRIIIGEFQK